LCSLWRTRRHVVFGEGNPEADLMFIGEAPGAEEDSQGIPFVGAAGQLLTRMISAIHYNRDDVYICNVLKCRPPKNRNPFPDEIRACTPFLLKQIEIIEPRIICTLGLFASQFMLKSHAPMHMLRGKAYDCGEYSIFPTYHPAALLRSPSLKREAWVDLQNLQRALT
jgi:DNA polymerase